MRESRLELEIANLVISRQTLIASAAPANKRHRNAVPGAPIVYMPADFLNNPGEFMAGDVRQFDIRVVPLPAVPVTAANTARHDPDDDTVGSGHGIRYLLDFGRKLKVSVEYGFHQA
jgi:hypothetical protein